MSDNPIILTESAINRLLQLMKDKQNNQLKLRIYIVGGGCAGFQYGFKFVDSPEPDDMMFTYSSQNEGLPIYVVVDTMSLMYLDGATLDFKVSLRGAQFLVINPHAETTCGCGASFSLKLD